VVEWLGGHELVVLVGLLVIVAGTWGFVALAGEVLEGDTQRFDERIIRALRRPDDPAVPIGPEWMEEVGRDITALGGVPLIVLVGAVLVTGLVGASRGYRGVQYPTDVLAGWTAGLVWATLCWLIGRALQRRGAIEPED